ncbi:MAG: outer membrane lipoprotein carrier protein LolA [Rikenellaceae bacterium]
MKKIILSLCFCSISLFCLAQQSDISSLVAKIAKPYSESNAFSVKFSAKISNSNVKGTIYVSGDKYRIDSDDFLMIYDGKHRYNYVKKNNEVYIETPEKGDNNVMQSPQRLLELTKNSEPILKENSDGTRILIFEKEDLELKLDKNDNILSIAVTDGNNTTINILSSDTNSAIKSSIFSFDKEDFKGAEIIDFR